MISILNEMLNRSGLSLNIGSGIRRYELGDKRNKPLKKFWDINIDILPETYPDVVCDANYLSFRDNVFNSCCVSHLLEHVDNPRNVINEIKRVVFNKGKVLIRTPQEKNINVMIYLLKVTLYSLFFYPSFIISLPNTFRLLSAINRKSPTALHKRIITLKFISRYFFIERIEEYGIMWFFPMNKILLKFIGEENIPSMFKNSYRLIGVNNK